MLSGLSPILASTSRAESCEFHRVKREAGWRSRERATHPGVIIKFLARNLRRNRPSFAERSFAIVCLHSLVESALIRDDTRYELSDAFQPSIGGLDISRAVEDCLGTVLGGVRSGEHQVGPSSNLNEGIWDVMLLDELLGDNLLLVQTPLDIGNQRVNPQTPTLS